MKITIKQLNQMIREEYRKVKEIKYHGYGNAGITGDEEDDTTARPKYRVAHEDKYVLKTDDLAAAIAKRDELGPGARIWQQTKRGLSSMSDEDAAAKLNPGPEMNLNKRNRKANPDLYSPDALGGTTYKGNGNFRGND